MRRTSSDGFGALAREAGCTMAQLALAWLLHREPTMLAVPGTTRIAHLHENLGAADVTLSPALVARVDEAINRHNVAGPRYTPANQAEVDTEDGS